MDEENDTSRATVLSLPRHEPCREPLQALGRNSDNNGKDSIFKDANNSKPSPIVIQRQSSSSFLSPTKILSPFAGGRTPNAGKILSPLPLQPRKLLTAEKKKANAEKLLSPKILTPAKGDAETSSLDEINEADDDGLIDLKLSKTFYYIDEDDDDDSLGWAYQLDDFEFVDKLGSGGCADVYLVSEKDNSATYALKVQPATEDALLELDLHVDLKHPSICRVFDYFFSEKQPFVEYDTDAKPHQPNQTDARYLCTMLEVCDRGDVNDLIDEHATVPENLAAKVMLQAILALKYLHSKDIIHCDIKPGNLLVHGNDSNTIIKLADFGMAVTSDAKEVVGGSPVYMAPEHLMAWRNLTIDFDHRTDIYSLGVVLYEMLMGYLPFEVLEADQMKKNQNAQSVDDFEESLAKEFLGLSVAEPSNEGLSTEHVDATTNSEQQNDYDYPVLDLRKLNDATSDQPFYIPPPIFVEEVSQEAQDLILRLMEPSASKRITLEEAQDHEWFRKVL